MRKANWKKIIFSGATFAILAQIIHSIGAMVSMNYYLDPAYFSVWSKLMMPKIGPPPTEFLLYALFFGTVTGIIYGWIYTLIEKVIPEKTWVKKGLWYGGMIFLIGGIPNYLTLLLLINLPQGLLINWAIEAFIANLLGGIIFSKVLG